MLVPTPEEFFIVDEFESDGYIQNTSKIEEPGIAVAGRINF